MAGKKAKRRMTKSIDLPAARRRIAQAVHLAVCKFTDSDGCGHCFHYALAGWVLAGTICKRPYVLQAGSLYIVADPPHGVVACEPEEHGFQRGEFHCWFAAAGQDGKIAEFVDLSSRHYRRLVERGPQFAGVTELEGASIVTLGADRIQWTRKDDPPEFIWTDGCFPNVMWAVPREDATNYFNKVVKDQFETFKPLVRLAFSYYRDLGLQGIGGQG